jgi:hypothetical protein
MEGKRNSTWPLAGGSRALRSSGMSTAIRRQVTRRAAEMKSGLQDLGLRERFAALSIGPGGALRSLMPSISA